MGKQHWTTFLADLVLDLVEHMTLKTVADFLHMSWDVVKDIHLLALRRRLKSGVRKIRAITTLAIDESAPGKYHKSLTIVRDLETGEVVWVGQGRGKDASRLFYAFFRDHGITPAAVAMDMWAPYIETTMEYFPDTDIVLDHYHVIALANRTLDEIRRLTVRSLVGEQARIVKGTRWILLKGGERIQNNQRARQRLEALAQANQPLYTAYLLKEELRALWTSCQTYEAAEQYLANWIRKAWASTIQPLVRLANTIAAHRTAILNAFRHPISTGPLEGTNNKIKTLKRQAYGYRDWEYFKLRILFIHEARYQLVGSTFFKRLQW